MAVKFVPALASMATLMVFTRLMAPDQFGEYSLTVNVTTTAVAILGNFLIIGLGRFDPAVTNGEDKKRLHSTIISSAIILSFVVGTAVITLTEFDFLPKLSVNYYFVAILFLLSTMLQLSQKLINANLKPKAYGLSIAIKNIFFLVAGTFCLLTGYGVHGVLASLSVASLLASLPALKLWSKFSWKKFDVNVFRQIWSYGAPLTLLYLFVIIISLSDRIFIDVLLGSEKVGLYSAGYDLTQYTIAVVASVVHLATFPAILKTYENNGEEEAKILLSASVRILLLLMIPVTLGFIAVKKEIAGIFLGESFYETSMLLIPILALSVLVSTIKSYYFDYSFQITKTTWLQSIPPMIAACCNCVLNYVLISKMGVIGAAYATLISYTIYLLLAATLSNMVFKLPDFPWAFVAKVFISGLVMMISVIFIQTSFSLVFSLLFKICIGSLIFILFIFILMKKDFLSLLNISNKVSRGVNGI
jgi:O-antigen/teichoic acid export membrane protein